MKYPIRALLRTGAALLVASGLSVAGAQAQSDTDALVAAAKAECAVTYYAANDPAVSKRLADAFEAKYGIPVEVVRLASGALAQRFAAEAETSTVAADLIVIAQPAFLKQAVSEGWIADIQGLPSLANWPEAYFDGKLATIGINAITIAWNSSMVSADEAPKSWEDLLDPKWKGKILFADVRTVPAFMGWAKLMRETYGEEFLEKLAAQDLRLVASVVPGSQQIAAGEAPVLAPAIHQVLVPLKTAGAPLEDVLVSPTTGVELVGGVSAAAPHPNAARLFFGFLLSSEGQALFNAGGGTSVLDGVEGVEALPEGYHAADIPEGEEAESLIQALGLN
jgi:iron(III) transport system substrate-binding protein